MSENMAQIQAPRKYRSADRVTKAYQALRGSASPGSAHQLELRVRRNAVELVRFYQRIGATDRASRFLFQLELARAGGTAPTLTNDLIADAQAADQLEDHWEHEYLLHRTPEARDRWLKALGAAVVRYQTLMRALESERDHA